MKSTNISIIALLSIVIIFCACTNEKMTDRPMPTETEVLLDMEEEGKSAAREAWFQSMRKTPEGTYWRNIELENQHKKHARRVEARQSNRIRGGVEEFANGRLRGEWKERGSVNLAGSVVKTIYDTETEDIYLVSAGGSIFKGKESGFEWEVVNQDFDFSREMLDFIDYNGSQRMIAAPGHIPHYSDDLGETWIRAEGVPEPSDGWGGVFDVEVILENSNPVILLLSKKSYWNGMQVYRSTDGGQTYDAIHTPGSHDRNEFKMRKAANSNDVYLADRIDVNSFDLYKYEQGQFILFKNVQDVGFGEARANLTGVRKDDGSTVFYIYRQNENQNGSPIRDIFMSEDEGASWIFQGTIPVAPWGVGLYALPSDPRVVVMGAVECFRSFNSGRTWTRINRWWEYYDDIINKLHADFMYFQEFERSDGSHFALISNHGGLSITENRFINNINIGTYGLNVSQYYSVRTDPTDERFIYAGAQDQGFQRGIQKPNQDDVEFDQVISGDYGHIVFTKNGERLWTVYPGGAVSYYQFPKSRTRTLTYNIDSDHESVWIPPLVANPDPSVNGIYMAGGNINGGTGSYVVQLKIENAQIVASQWDYDFRSASGDGKISAIEFSPINHDIVYVATDNGRFFYSKDGGQSFSRTLVGNIPGGHYLYGSDIYASKFDEDVVFICGNGYSNNAVYKSDDGGQVFRKMGDNQPKTLAFGMAPIEDESMIFLATEAGPYVWIEETNEWYDISGISAPAQKYWCVEYLPEDKIVRYGTYGRGIWDFNIEEIITNHEELTFAEAYGYPNPCTDYFNIDGLSRIVDYKLIDHNGRLIRSGKIKDRLNVSALPPGGYFLQLGEGYYSKQLKFIKQ